MRIKHLALIGVGVAALVTASSLALYYRQQSAYFHREWRAAMAELGRTSSAAVQPAARVARLDDANWETYDAPKKADAARSERGPHRAPGQPALERPAPASTVTSPPSASDPERARRRGSDWGENLRETDPQRYEEMQQRREAMKQYVQDAWAQKTNYFLNRDTSKMSDPEVEEYTLMVSLLDETKALSDRLQGGVPREDRWQVISNLRSNIVVLTPLLDNERNREYYDLAVAMGHGEADAAAFVSYVNQIASNTSLRTILPPGIVRDGMPGRWFPGSNSPPRASRSP